MWMNMSVPQIKYQWQTINDRLADASINDKPTDASSQLQFGSLSLQKPGWLTKQLQKYFTPASVKISQEL